jgi:hypothetical protein
MHRLGEGTQVEPDDGFFQPQLSGGDDFGFIGHMILS